MFKMAENQTNESIAHDDTDSFRYEKEGQLPIANVTRIVKKVLPTGSKISKDAKECIQECVTEFVSFVSGEASDRCLQEKRKTINGDDIIWALQSLGFDFYSEPLKAYLQKYRDQTITSKRTLTKNFENADGSESYIQNDMALQYNQNQNYLNPYYVTHEQYRGLLDITSQQTTGIHKDDSMNLHKNAKHNS